MEGQETGLLTESPEAETSVEEGHRDWASLPLPVVDSLVRVLKDARRWRLEGRSLRLINKHWSAAVTMHVEEIRPDTTRIIADEDIASLSKFKRLTSVDISPFLIRPPRHAIPKNRKQKMVFLKNWFDAKLRRIVDMLCEMPELAQIEVGLKTIIILHYHCARTREHFSTLERITSVYLYNSKNVKFYGETPLSKTWAGQLYGQQQSDYSSIIAQLVCSLGGLETLEVEGLVLDSCTQFGFLDQVKRVTLQGVDSRILTRLSNPSATVSSVVVLSPATFTRNISVQLTRLGGLSLLEEVSSDDLAGVHLSPAAKNLKVLDISVSDFDISAFPNETITVFMNVECLNIVSCLFAGASLRGHFPNLKALRFADCTVTDSDVTFVTQFRKLELLDWYDVLDPQFKSLHLPWEKLELPKLRSLCVIPILDDSELLSISRQTNLEVLLVGSYYDQICASNITNEGLRLLEELVNLRILYVEAYETKARRMWSSLLSSNMLTKLEQLWVWFYPEYDEDEDSLKRIKCISPHLILKSGLYHFLDFDCARFI